MFDDLGSRITETYSEVRSGLKNSKHEVFESERSIPWGYAGVGLFSGVVFPAMVRAFDPSATIGQLLVPSIEAGVLGGIYGGADKKIMGAIGRKVANEDLALLYAFGINIGFGLTRYALFTHSGSPKNATFDTILWQTCIGLISSENVQDLARNEEKLNFKNFLRNLKDVTFGQAKFLAQFQYEVAKDWCSKRYDRLSKSYQ